MVNVEQSGMHCELVMLFIAIVCFPVTVSNEDIVSLLFHMSRHVSRPYYDNRK